MRNPNAKFSGVEGFVTNPGDRTHILYESRFNGSRLELFEAGREDLQDLIEAYGPYADLNYMLNRLKVGDASVLSSRKPVYGDFSSFPRNPVDAINLIHSAEDAFARLDRDTKLKYNNDYRLWLSSIMSSGVPDVGSPVNSDDTTASLIKEESSNES